MKIGGIQPMTLIDYPGKVAMTLFTIGCNFRCQFCHNPDLVLPKKNPSVYNEQEVFNLIKSRGHLLDAVCLTGGEPCLQKDLLKFIKKLKALGLAVKLDTNGTMPNVLEDLLKHDLIDYFAMDIKAPWQKYAQVTTHRASVEKIKKSAIIIKSSGLTHEFRSTVVPGLHTAQDVVTMARQVKGADKFFIQRFVSAPRLVNDDWQDTKNFTYQELNQIKNKIKDWFKVCSVR